LLRRPEPVERTPRNDDLCIAPHCGAEPIEQMELLLLLKRKT